MASHLKGQLQSRPRAQKNLGSNTTGLRQTGLDTERDGFLYVPESFDPKASSPLVIALHASKNDAAQAVKTLRPFADLTGTILLAPQAQAQRWNGIAGSEENDAYFIDEALSDIFALYPIDPQRIAISGFGDGADYALFLGTQNEELFSHVIAFAPEKNAEPPLTNRLFIGQGNADDIRKAFIWFLGSWHRAAELRNDLHI